MCIDQCGRQSFAPVHGIDVQVFDLQRTLLPFDLHAADDRTFLA